MPTYDSQISRAESQALIPEDVSHEILQAISRQSFVLQLATRLPDMPTKTRRLPVLSVIHQLTRDDLVTILTEPRNALVKQFQRFFDFDGIELVFADDSLISISDKALERETGARGLRSILEDTLLDVQFELPSRRDVKKCVVTKETIAKGLKPTLVTEAADEAEEPPEEQAESA